MTALVCSVEQYRLITGDTSSATAEAEAAIDAAQALLEDELGRQVGYGTRTETVCISTSPSGGTFAAPSVFPVHSAVGLTVDGDLIRAVTPASSPGVDWTEPVTAEVTYTAGWDRAITDRSDLRCPPQCVVRDVALAAHTILDRSATSVPAGATSVANGDVKVTFGPGGAPGASAPEWSRQTLRWRRRRL